MRTTTNYKHLVADLLKEPTGLSIEEIEALFNTPTNREHGDLAFPCFSLAKKLRKAPAAIAQELASQLSLPEEIQSVEAIAAYLNFKWKRSIYHRSILNQIVSEDSGFGKNSEGEGKTVTIDFSSPNMGKELAFHHLRGTMLGNSLSRLYEMASWKVIRINYLGDWGTSYGKLIAMYLREGNPTDEKSLATIEIEALNRLYQTFSKEAEKDPELEQKAREEFKLLEQDDPLRQKLWLAFRDATLKELRRIYGMLGLDFDDWKGEAFFVPRAKSLLKDLESHGQIIRSQGALIAELSQYDLPPFLLQKSDGSTLYATRDLCAAIWRQENYAFDRSLYVVDNGQSLHFQQLFLVLKNLGYSWTERCEHIPFGLILNKSEEGRWEKGKTRAGRASLLKDVLEAAKERIAALMSEKKASVKNPDETAMQIGIGALVFDTLKNKRLNDIRFDWETVLSFEGDTGPYVQNAHVRLCSILQKGPELSSSSKLEWELLSGSEEASLIQKLAEFPERIQTALRINDPYQIAQFCLEISELTHGFIHKCRVLGSPEEKERLFLVNATRITLRNALTILGVPAIEAM